MRLVRSGVFDRGVRTKLTASLRNQVAGNLLDKGSANSLSTVFAVDPDAFEERNGLRSASICILSYTDLRKTDMSVIWENGNVANTFFTLEHSFDFTEMLFKGKATPHFETHFRPTTTIRMLHFLIKTDIKASFRGKYAVFYGGSDACTQEFQ
jgi:hypothetical protein